MWVAWVFNSNDGIDRQKEKRGEKRPNTFCVGLELLGNVWTAQALMRYMVVITRIKWALGRGESGWCSDMASVHGTWGQVGVRFSLSGVVFV